MVRIGLISDTHIPDRAKVLPPKVPELFRGVDLILHAGDIYVPAVLDELERIAPVFAAEGDDEYPGTSEDPRVKLLHVLDIGGLVVWLTHEKPSPLQPIGDNGLPDILVCGHTHFCTVEGSGGVTLVNPGSAIFPNYRYDGGTVALLTISAGKPKIEILELR